MQRRMGPEREKRSKRPLRSNAGGGTGKRHVSHKPKEQTMLKKDIKVGGLYPDADFW